MINTITVLQGHGAPVQVRKAALSQVVPQVTGNHAATL